MGSSKIGSSPVSDFLQGAAAMGSVVVGLFFLTFWKQARDRLFLAFGVGFIVFALNRTLLVVIDSNEATAYIYGLRLAAFMLILAGIIDKNLGSRHR